MKIRYFTCRHAGSAHDAKIFGDSSLRQTLLEDFNATQPLAIFGDEAYAAEDLMLPPVRKSQMRNASPEMKEKMIDFNKVHKKTRILVEHTFGILKKRFPVLLYAVRSKYLENVQALVASVIIIHNILIDIKEPFPVSNGFFDDERMRRQLSRFDFNQELSIHEREKFRLQNMLLNNFF